VFASRLLFGHRGAPATGLSENSIASFARALADGATALETDVHTTKDGLVVCAHDPTLRTSTSTSSSTARARIVDHTHADLLAMRSERERDHGTLPLLRDVLDRFRDVPVNLDIKQAEPRMERAVVDVIGADAERCLLASFHPTALDRVRALGYRGPTGLGKNEIARIVAAPSFVARLWKPKGARAQVPKQSGRFRFDTRAFVDACHALGIAVDYWVINDVDDARALLALGADGIMSDAPGTVAAAFG
jgi:glycerophosphoryl diester phosphodiesterase